MREVCFILTKAGTILRIYYGSEAAIPDARERWETIWEHRADIAEIVHTHPGEMLRFSEEDRTTMEAVEAATGLKFHWSVVTRSGYLSRWGCRGRNRVRKDAPWWLETLRELSFGRS